MSNDNDQAAGGDLGTQQPSSARSSSAGSSSGTGPAAPPPRGGGGGGGGRCRRRSPRLSNPHAALPLRTLYEIPQIISDDEAADLIGAIDGRHHYREWLTEGYDRRYRVQRYSPLDCASDDDDDGDGSAGGRVSMEGAFGWIFDRIVADSPRPNLGDGQGEDADRQPSAVRLHRPFEVVVIEHTSASCRSVVNTFEQNALCPCRQQQKNHDQGRGKDDAQYSNDDDSSICNCYVAQLTLVNDAIQHVEKPLRRELECWDLASPVEHHETRVVMERNGVVVKMGESLWDWRGRISDIQEKGSDCEGGGGSDDLSLGMDSLSMEGGKKKPWARSSKSSNKRCITVTFRGIRQPELVVPAKDMTAHIAKAVQPSPPLSSLLTIIVTTSPIRSHPSTEMLERTFDTFPFGGDEFAYECPKVIVCDGCRVLDEDDNREEKKDEAAPQQPPKITRKYSNVKQTLRNGIATIDQAKNYDEFKSRLRKLCEEADASAAAGAAKKSPFRNARVVELDERHGYGFALRHALYHCVDTPYVCVIQHDRTFMRPTPVKEAVAAMESDFERKIKYVGMSQRSNLMYHDIFSGKYGRKAGEEFKTMILRPGELCIGDNMYGPDSKSVENMVAPKNEKRRKILEALKETYRGSHQHLTYKEQSKGGGGGGTAQEEGFHQLTLSPTLFWYDNTHIVQTTHYRDFIFHPQYRMVARGGFVEDKLSPCMIRNCERLGLRDGHAKFGCYLLDDHSGVTFTGHLDGGSYMTADLHRSPKGDKYAEKIANSAKRNH